MKKNRTFLKFILIVSAVMFGLTILLLYLSTKRAENDSYIQIDTDTMKLIQLEPPKDGDPIAVVDTTLGEFRFVLYPEQSPEAVKNFTSLAESGYYDNTYIYNAEEGVYASAGSKLKSGEMPEGYGLGCIENDSAIVFPPEGMGGEGYILTVMSTNLGGRNSEAISTIAQISSMVAQWYSEQYQQQGTEPGTERSGG